MSALVLAVLLVGCAVSEGDVTPSFTVLNDLGHPVELGIVHNGVEEQPIRDPRLEPGESEEYGLADHGEHNADEDSFCTNGAIIIRNDEGAELGRIPPPVCAGASVRLSAYVADT